MEKVGTAYTPTKVNMAELTARKDESSSNDRPEVVKGAYQPVGKVDIAAIRAQAKDAKDDRPTVVKGAYEPVGKVDIAAIRAKAQAAPPSPGPPKEEEDETPKSLAERSAAFKSQPERLTSMPKPKVANKFAGASFQHAPDAMVFPKPIFSGRFGMLGSNSPNVSSGSEAEDSSSAEEGDIVDLSQDSEDEDEVVFLL